MGKKVLGIFACLGIILGGVYYLLHGSGVPSSIGMDSTNINGPDRLVGKIDIKDSPYFKAPDFYNMKSGGSLILLEKFLLYILLCSLQIQHVFQFLDL